MFVYNQDMHIYRKYIGHILLIHKDIYVSIYFMSMWGKECQFFYIVTGIYPIALRQFGADLDFAVEKCKAVPRIHAAR